MARRQNRNFSEVRFPRTLFEDPGLFLVRRLFPKMNGYFISQVLVIDYINVQFGARYNEPGGQFNTSQR
jgi:hypothetical protein